MMQRTGKDLIAATKPFAEESRLASWWYTLSTFMVLAVLTGGAARAPWLPLRVAASVIEGLVIVRVFILYHDHLHSALLRGSVIAKWIMFTYGLVVLTPPTVWRSTHNYHHAHTAKIVGSHIGSYAMVTVDMWKQLSRAQRVMYRVTRHPLNILFAYFTVFAYGMCASAFLRNPRKHWDGLASLVVHVALSFGIAFVAGAEVWLLALFVPTFVACASGAYLFYVQHNFPDVYVQRRDAWSYDRAALESSSYLEMGQVMNWLTGNIGYHHVHHLNPGIPFYRLPEAMARIPELQHPRTTSLRPRDVLAAFRLKLWDPETGKMVGYPSERPAERPLTAR